MHAANSSSSSPDLMSSDISGASDNKTCLRRHSRFHYGTVVRSRISGVASPTWLFSLVLGQFSQWKAG